jgi:hypothetical protein
MAITYTRFEPPVGKATYAKLKQKDYDFFGEVLKEVITDNRFERPLQEINTTFGKNRDTREWQTYEMMLFGLYEKYSRGSDFTIKQLDILNTILNHLDIDSINFIEQ